MSPRPQLDLVNILLQTEPLTFGPVPHCSFLELAGAFETAGLHALLWKYCTTVCNIYRSQVLQTHCSPIFIKKKEEALHTADYELNFLFWGIQTLTPKNATCPVHHHIILEEFT